METQTRSLEEILGNLRTHIETKGAIGGRSVTTATPRPVPETRPSASSSNDENDGQKKMPTEPPLKHSREAQEQLTLLLSQAYASQQTYGDKAAMMEFRDQMFQLVLADYSLTKIKQAFVDHISRKATLPSPSDIVNLIDPPAPKPDWAAYVGIKAKMRDGSSFVMPDQRRYVAWCEDYVASNLKTYDDNQAAKSEIATLEAKLLPTPEII